MDDAQLIDSPRERSALTFVQFSDHTDEGSGSDSQKPVVNDNA